VDEDGLVSDRGREFWFFSFIQGMRGEEENKNKV